MAPIVLPLTTTKPFSGLLRRSQEIAANQKNTTFQFSHITQQFICTRIILSDTDMDFPCTYIMLAVLMMHIAPPSIKGGARLADYIIRWLHYQMATLLTV